MHNNREQAEPFLLGLSTRVNTRSMLSTTGALLTAMMVETYVLNIASINKVIKCAAVDSVDYYDSL